MRAARRAWAALAALVLLGAGDPVLAQPWTATSTARTGQLTAATVGHRFSPVSGGGAGGATYTTSTLLAVEAPRVVDLVNTSDVPVTMTGTVELRSAVLALAASVQACAGAWDGSTCRSGALELLRSPVGAPRAVTWASAPVPPGGRVHLRITFSVAAVATLTTTATAVPARAAGDRSGG